MSKILIIEPTGFLCRLLARSITEKGYAAMAAKNPQQAFKSLAGASLVLLDLEMRSKLSKAAICKKILEIAPDASIYLVTSRMESIEKKVAKFGAKGYLRKPVSPQEFAKFLDSIVGESQEPAAEVATELPVPAEDPMESLLEAIETEADTSQKSEHTCHILVVQQEGALCAELNEASSEKMEFVGAQSLDEAIEQLQEKRPCLLIFDMDWRGDLPAEEACQMLSNWDMQHIPTALLLSSFEEADTLSARLKADAYHLKPVSGLFIYSWLEQGPKFFLKAHNEPVSSQSELKEVPPITPAGCSE